VWISDNPTPQPTMNGNCAPDCSTAAQGPP
jgi:hypothetical protein